MVDYEQEVKKLVAKESGLKLADIPLEVPPNLELGDYAFPCFILSKELKKAPVKIAEELLKKIHPTNEISKIEAKGPYLNFFINRKILNKEVIESVLKDKSSYGSGSKKSEKVMVEYSQPNTHKAFHVGHLRNVCMGDSIVRLKRNQGYEVIAVNYIGDVGAHIAKCLWYYINFLKEKPPKVNRGEWLGKIYTQAVKKLAEDVDGTLGYKEEVSKVLQALESGEKVITALWRETADWSLEDFNSIYDWLGVKFDKIFFESDVEKEGKKLVEKYKKSPKNKKGLFEESDGALILDLEKYGLGVFLALKSDGTSLYSTKDLALAAKKFGEFGIDKSLYVVGSEQKLYFNQLFKTLELMGFKNAKNCEHVSYELVMVPEGKMSSRAGNVILFSELKSKIMSVLIGEVKKRHNDWSKDKIEATAKKIALGALKFGMLSSDNNKVIVFSLDDWVSFEGETGPYIQYVVARINSIIRKSGMDINSVDYSLLNDPLEQKLVSLIKKYPEVVKTASSSNRPSILCRYLIDIAQAYNEFYHSCQILKADSSLRGARISLSLAVKFVIVNGLFLLGITAPEEM